MEELKSIAEELAACREACKDLKIGDPVWCLHHERLVETLEEPIGNRLNYILASKSKDEQARRFRELRPLSERSKKVYAEYKPRWDALDAEYNQRRDALYAEYKPRWDALYAEYKPRWDALDAEYKPRWDALDAEYKPRRDALDAEYKPRWDALYAEYNQRRDALDAEYNQRRDALDAELEAVHKQDVLDTLWNGKTIFA